MNASNSILHIVLDSDDEMDEIIAEFAEEEEEKQVESEDEIGGLLDGFDAGADSPCESEVNVPVIVTDDDVCEAISEFSLEMHLASTNNTTIDDRDCTVESSKNNENKTIYSSSFEVLDDNSKDLKESSNAENSSPNDNFLANETDLPKFTSDNEITENKNYTDNKSTMGTAVPESNSVSSVNISYSASESSVSTNEPCENVPKKNLSNKDTNLYLSEECKNDVIVNSNLLVSNSDEQKNSAQNNSPVDVTNNYTAGNREYMMICDKDNKYKTIYSSSVEILDSQLTSEKQSSNSIESSDTNDCLPLSINEPTPASSSTAPNNISDDAVPKSEAFCCISSVNSVSEITVMPNGLNNNTKEIVNKNISQNLTDEKVILFENSNCVKDETYKTTHEMEFHLKMNENLQCNDNEVKAQKQNSPINVISSATITNCQKRVVHKYAENMESNTNTLSTENESIQNSNINDSTSDRMKTSVSVEHLNNSSDKKFTSEKCSINEKELLISSNIEDPKKDFISHDSDKTISKENCLKQSENFSVHDQPSLPASCIPSLKKDCFNSLSERDISITDDSGSLVAGLNRCIKTSPMQNLDDQMQSSSSVEVNNITSVESGSLIGMNDDNAESHIQLEPQKLSDSPIESEITNSERNIISPDINLSRMTQEGTKEIATAEVLSDIDDSPVESETTNSERNVISPDINLTRMIQENTKEIATAEVSSDIDEHHQQECSITMIIEASDAAEEHNLDITVDDGANSIVYEEVLENGKLLASSDKRKLEISESEFSSKRLKGDTSNCNESSVDMLDDFDSMKDTNIEELVSNVTVADIKAVDKINQLIPWNPAEKIETTRKTLDRIALYVCEEIVKECFKKKYDQGRNEVKLLEKKIEKLTADLENFRSLAKEFSTSQKISFANRCFEKVTTRTVGVNVKIFKESDIRRALEVKSLSTAGGKDPNSCAESSLLEVTNADSVPEITNTRTVGINTNVLEGSNITAEMLSPNNDILPENTSKLKIEISPSVSIPESSGNTSKLKIEISPSVSIPDSSGNDLPKISSLPCIIPTSHGAASCAPSSIPAAVPLPRVMDGDRLIPYINPSKPSSSHKPPIMLVPRSISVHNGQIANLQKERREQNGIVHNGVMSNVAVGKEAKMSDGLPILMALKDFVKMFPNVQSTSFSQQQALQPHSVREDVKVNHLPQRDIDRGMPSHLQPRIPQLQLLQLRTSGHGVDLNSAANSTIMASTISQQAQSSKPSPSNGILLFNHPRKDHQNSSNHPFSTFNPPVRTHQTSVPLQSLTVTMPHPRSVIHHVTSSVPCRSTYMHRLASPMLQPRSMLIRQNQVPVNKHYFRPLQQCPTSVQNNSVPLQHRSVPSYYHHRNPLSIRSIPYIPSNPHTDENGRVLLPTPQVKGSVKDDGSVVISWNLISLEQQSNIAYYQIYSYQEKDSSEGPPIWKSVGDVASLELPMACTLKHFEENARYYFTVRAVDKFKHHGPFSDPVTIDFTKRNDSSTKN